ncbi:hypothetical protein CPC735_025350 [Coccidioides posadasii C735 delta SOWgp]|uniref:Uncharacterized protein n=2 Tax=Coccidioides posadasii TaxID=199306 RepID=A0A0J6FDI3_COCPO|nr:hypothetical protein CPC735_025350 [Coccidioides posadasii C735 delta SOWgp]EER27199.1 hypothetical protein CPC735_025350 [Coccidioides posadasii C735 delta SOWgp]KMM66939.1 hypothetical protein CPAG_03275 [Coccidioides posadasii RMSCC 3488]|eukprot:XP_003069344.1 hypothetical protein CPC735_025350 [Coccidioides posadasii C735 delta SOWgp]
MVASLTEIRLQRRRLPSETTPFLAFSIGHHGIGMPNYERLCHSHLLQTGLRHACPERMERGTCRCEWSRRVRMVGFGHKSQSMTYLIPQLDFVDTPNLPDLFRTCHPSPDPLPRMNALGARAFSTSAYRSITFRGSGFEAMLHQNGPDGGHWQSMVKRITDDIEKADPRIKVADIQGGRAHKSSNDPKDPFPVITVGLLTTENSKDRIGSIHVHFDGTFKFFPSRKGDLGKYLEQIRKAGIPGFIDTIPEETEGETANSATGQGKELAQ